MNKNEKKPVKKVEYNYITGAPVNVILPLLHSLKIFLTKYHSVKVGITGRDPQRRFGEHLKKRPWNRMIVRYKTSSENFANQLEQFFIVLNPGLKNYWLGTSNLCKKGDNYLYFLLYGEKTKK